MTRRYGSKEITRPEAKAQLIQLLYGCTPEKLASFTVDGLCRTHRVDERTVEYELTIARQKRGIA